MTIDEFKHHYETTTGRQIPGNGNCQCPGLIDGRIRHGILSFDFAPAQQGLPALRADQSDSGIQF